MRLHSRWHLLALGLLLGLLTVACEEPSLPADKTRDGPPQSRQSEPAPPDLFDLDRLPEGAITRVGPAPCAAVVKVTPLAFAPDGKTLAASVQPPGSKVCRLYRQDAVSRKLLHPFPGEAKRFQHAAFSPDGTILGAVTDHSVIFWDTRMRKQVHAFLEPEEVWGPKFCFSPDSRTIALWGLRQFKGNRVTLWHTVGWREVERFEMPDDWCWGATFSSDGKTLLAHSVTDHKPEPEPGQPRQAAGAPFRFDAICSPYRCRVCSWDVATGRLLQNITILDSFDGLAFTPDATGLLYHTEREDFGLWNLVRNEKQACVDGCRCPRLAFSPDGKLLAVSDEQFRALSPCRLLDSQTLGEVRHLEEDELAKRLVVCFSPDGQSLLTSDGQLFAASTGRPLPWAGGRERELIGLAWFPGPVALAAGGLGHLYGREPDCFQRLDAILRDVGIKSNPGELPLSLALAFDGKTMATKFLAARGEGPFRIQLFDTSPGKEILRMKIDGDDYPNQIALSPNGQSLLTCDVADGFGTVTLWDLRHRRKAATLVGHASEVRAMAFAPDGRSFASAGEDGTIVIWDATRFLRHDQQHADRPVPAEGLLTALSAEDAGQAWRAVWDLVDRPEQALVLLRSHLRPAGLLDAKEVARRLADLDDDDFDVREQASAWLEKQGETIEPTLRQALAARPSPEAERRLVALLRLLPQPAETAEGLLALRATAVLEGIGTEDACRQLRELAVGHPDALLTREAKAALQRLERRP
jgi:WD40 repeat protein